MPLIMHRGQIPAGWAGKDSTPLIADRYNLPVKSMKIALINNMPDSALEDTGRQFFSLLNAAADDMRISFQLFSLPQIVRSERVREHLDNYYSDINELLNGRFDGVIITGTEPLRKNLREEAYWPALTQLFDWAERNTISTILSCLAAHASVLHCDGIERHRLGDKQFGVFSYQKTADHALINQTVEAVRFPHSRWNEVREDALTACGYSVLTHSPDAGVDCFVKRKKQSLFVHFQGHPEYDTQTLLKEYRRDIKRFLRSERETYPNMPQGYFDLAATRLLNDFREKALQSRHEDYMSTFPDASVSDSPVNTWRASAVSIYRNWLNFISARTTERVVFAPVSRVDRPLPASANSEIA
jgi:homoserine O-succinyltransferase/O-acetyltransferase